MSATVAVIPARGGSKGIPGKNLLSVAGQPLIVWTIQQALALEDLPVVVSTDDTDIAAVARAAGAEVINRPAELSLDTTPTEPVVEHAIASLGAAGRHYDHVMLLQATSPIRLPGTIERALNEFEDSAVDSLVGVVPSPPFLWHGDASNARAAYDHTRRPRRQDLTPDQLPYRETGSLYLTKSEIYADHHNRLGGRIGLFIMDPVEGLDIDDLADLEVAESRLRHLGWAR